MQGQTACMTHPLHLLTILRLPRKSPGLQGGEKPKLGLVFSGQACLTPYFREYEGADCLFHHFPFLTTSNEGKLKIYISS